MLKQISFAVAVTAAALTGLTMPAAAQEQIELEFTVWNYSIDTIQDNIRK